LQDGYNQHQQSAAAETKEMFFGIPIISQGMPLPPPPVGFTYGYINQTAPTMRGKKLSRKPGKKKSKKESGSYSLISNPYNNIGLIP
jgi:hypothetical protein